MVLRRTFLGTISAAAFAQTQPEPPLPRITKIIAGGDVMLARNVGIRARAQKDPAWPFRLIAPVFAAADIAFLNLESPFNNQGPLQLHGMIFKAEPDMIAGLTLAGIDIVSTANNHARDQQSRGLEFTLDHLAENGILAVGTGKTEEEAHAGQIIERNGTKFGFLAYTYDANNGNHKDTDPRIAILDTDRMREDLAALHMKADVVLVSMHAGVEYELKPNRQQTEFARAAIDAGAAAVIGHHPHVRQPMELYEGAPIFYSLGNLVFDQFQRTETQIGTLAELTFEGSRLTKTNTRTVRLPLTVPRVEEELDRRKVISGAATGPTAGSRSTLRP
jgi:poly-gamma-glutamate capsule biosynthesis protein CapA/YwtB (metallophosphatase superfamily)